MTNSRDVWEGAGVTGCRSSVDNSRGGRRRASINALEHSVEIVSTIASEPRNWKWLLIAVHNALQ